MPNIDHFVHEVLKSECGELTQNTSKCKD